VVSYIKQRKRKRRKMGYQTTQEEMKKQISVGWY
jgi:hypothetical protein